MVPIPPLNGAPEASKAIDVLSVKIFICEILLKRQQICFICK